MHNMDASQTNFEEPMISLTLATGEDRWSHESISPYCGNMRPSGRLWFKLMQPDVMVDTEDAERVVLRREVADWCWENIGPYRIIDHKPSDEIGPDGDDSWEIVFKDSKDAIAFKLRWM